jgi:hypothetical protein
MACGSCGKRGHAISTGIAALRDGQTETVKRAARYVAGTLARDAGEAAQSAARSLALLKAKLNRTR